MTRRRIALALRALAFVLAVGVALAPVAQAQTAGANLVGTVTAQDGTPLPGATVTATQTETGVTRTAVSETDGTFRLPSLPIGLYRVEVSLDGFSTVTVENVRLNVATEREIDVTMGSATVEETITVTSEAPLIETTPSMGTVVSEQQLESLPLNGRQFANVAVLAPGTSLAYNTDPTKPGQLTIALNGGIGRNVNYIVDGGDNTDDTIGGALQNFNLDAVEEFKIQTAQYKAEYGRSSGGVLTVVTKTGTNEFHGSVYEYARRDDWNSRTETEKRAGADKSPYERDQYGATLGGPIVRDRAHFFATYEKLERAGQYLIDTGGSFPAFDGDVIDIPFEDELGTAKVTFEVSPTQFLQVRYGFQENADFYGASPLTLPSSLGALTNEYESILGSHTWQLGSEDLNEFVFQYTTFENSIAALSNDPAVIFPSGVQTGQNQNTPQTTLQTKYQYRDDFSFSRTIGGRRHDFKAGAQYVHEPTLGGSFTSGTAGVFTMLTNDPNGPVRDITLNAGASTFDTPVDQYAVYFQDDWAFSDRLTLNLGIRYDLNDGVGGLELDQSSNRLCQFLTTQTTYNEYYLQEFRGWDCKGEKDDDNWAPRLGFSWDMGDGGRQVLRGGIGRFYDFPYTNATVLFPAIEVQSNFGQVYGLTDVNGIRNPDGSFFRPGQPLPPGGALPPGAPPAVVNVASPQQEAPYSDQISLGYSWQVSNRLGVAADAIWAEYSNIPYRFRFNSRLDANGNPTGSFRFPAGLAATNARMWMGDGEAEYKGLNLSARFREEKFELQGFYTLSEAEGNVLAGADEFRLGAASFQSDYQSDRSIDSRNPRCGRCFGPLYTDARHRVTFGGIYNAPWELKVATFLRYRSALPYNLLATNPANGGLLDVNGDGFSGDIEPGAPHVNSERGSSFSQIDVRLSRDFVFTGDIGIELIAEVFNLLNEENPAVFDRFGEAHAFAGDPAQGEQRLMQFGARIHF